MDTAAALDRVAELADTLPLDTLRELLAAVETYGDLRADQVAAELAAELPAAWGAAAYVGDGTRVHRVTRDATGRPRTLCGRAELAAAQPVDATAPTCLTCRRVAAA